MIGNLYTNIACYAFCFLQFLEYKVDNYEFKERQKGDWNVTDWN